MGVAALVQLSGDGTAEKVRVGLTGVDEKPVRARGVEEELEGKKLSEDLIARAAERASEGINPPTDIRASAEYRRRMARALTKQALTRAFKRASRTQG